jgi:hypothetical protein
MVNVAGCQQLLGALQANYRFSLASEIESWPSDIIFSHPNQSPSQSYSKQI